MHSGVGGQTELVQIWSTIHQQLRVPDLPPDVSIMDWASCPQQVPLVMMRPIVSTAQSMIINRKSHTGFRMVPTSVTLNDLERHNSPYFASFYGIW